MLASRTWIVLTCASFDQRCFSLTLSSRKIYRRSLALEGIFITVVGTLRLLPGNKSQTVRLLLTAGEEHVEFSNVELVAIGPDGREAFSSILTLV